MRELDKLGKIIKEFFDVPHDKSKRQVNTSTVDSDRKDQQDDENVIREKPIHILREYGDSIPC